MKDLQVMFNGAVGLLVFGILGAIAIYIALNLLLLAFRLIIGFFSYSNWLTRLNPYIMAHKQKLLEEKHYREYLAVAKKDEIVFVADKEEKEK